MGVGSKVTVGRGRIVGFGVGVFDSKGVSVGMAVSVGAAVDIIGVVVVAGPQATNASVSETMETITDLESVDAQRIAKLLLGLKIVVSIR